jgi:hypothetical protein
MNHLWIMVLHKMANLLMPHCFNWCKLPIAFHLFKLHCFIWCKLPITLHLFNLDCFVWCKFSITFHLFTPHCLIWCKFQLHSIQMPLSAFAYSIRVIRITNARSSLCFSLTYTLKGMAKKLKNVVRS